MLIFHRREVVITTEGFIDFLTPFFEVEGDEKQETTKSEKLTWLEDKDSAPETTIAELDDF